MRAIWAGSNGVHLQGQAQQYYFQFRVCILLRESAWEPWVPKRNLVQRIRYFDCAMAKLHQSSGHPIGGVLRRPHRAVSPSDCVRSSVPKDQLDRLLKGIPVSKMPGWEALRSYRALATCHFLFRFCFFVCTYLPFGLRTTTCGQGCLENLYQI